MLNTPNDQAERRSGALPPFNLDFALQSFQPTVVEKAWTTWVEMNQHWTKFLTERFQEDSSLVHQLTRCTDPSQVISVYSGFFQKAAADYSREFAAMTGLGQAWFADATTSLRQGITASNGACSGQSSRTK